MPEYPFNEASVVIEDLHNKLLRLLDLLGSSEYSNWILKESSRLKGKYPNFGDYNMWHVFVGGSYESYRSFFDFPEPDSIVGLVNAKVAEYEKKAN